MIHKASSAAVIACLSAAILAGCSGGSTTPAPVGAVAPTNAGPTAPTGSSIKRRFNLFIPRKLAAASSARKATGSTRRQPQYVSYATAGIGIVTKQFQPFSTSPQIDSESFSTSSNDNPNCTPSEQIEVAGTNCSFTVGVLSGGVIISVSAYSTEPNTPTGGNATAFPSNATLLSTSSAYVGINAGVNTAIGLSLQGVPASAHLLSTIYPDFSDAVPDQSAPPISTIGGQGPPVTTQLGVQIVDASNNIVVGSDPLASAVTVTVTETGGSGHTTLTDQTTDASGNTTTSQPATAVTIQRPSDAVFVTYDRQGTAGYNASFAMKFDGSSDYNGVANGASGTGSGSLSPVFLAAASTFATDAPTATFALDSNGVPTISDTQPSGPSENPTFSLVESVASTQPQDPNAPSISSPSANGSCTTVGFAPARGSEVLEFTGGPTQTCGYTVGDGTTGGQQAFNTTYTQPAGLSFFPSSFAGYDCSPEVTCASAYQGMYISNEFTSNPGTPAFGVVSCTADANSGCYEFNQPDGSQNSYAYCLNDSGLLYANQNGSNELQTGGEGGVYGNDSSDPHAQNTGDFTCTFGISDGLGGTFQFPESFHVGAQTASAARKASMTVSKASLAYAREARALSAYATVLAKRKADAAIFGARALAIIKANEVKHH